MFKVGLIILGIIKSVRINVYTIEIDNFNQFQRCKFKPKSNIIRLENIKIGKRQKYVLIGSSK